MSTFIGSWASANWLARDCVVVVSVILSYVLGMNVCRRIPLRAATVLFLLLLLLAILVRHLVP